MYWQKAKRMYGTENIVNTEWGFKVRWKVCPDRTFRPPLHYLPFTFHRKHAHATALSRAVLVPRTTMAFIARFALIEHSSR